jgi:hypothetical protein
MKKKYNYKFVTLPKPIKFKKRNHSKENYLGYEFLNLIAIIFNEGEKSSCGVIVQSEDSIEEYYGNDCSCFYTHYIPCEKP